MLRKKGGGIFKKGFSFLILLSMAASAFSLAVLAEETDKKEAPLVITAFKTPENLVYTVQKENMAELVNEFPDHLNVILEHGAEASVPVTWECEDDYENTAYDLYSFHPVYDTENYIMSPPLTVWDVPYIDVHIQTDGILDMQSRMIYPANPNGTRTIDQYLGAENLLAWLNSHEKDAYYVGTPYRGIGGTVSWSNPRDCMQPTGDVQSGYTAGMNCTGFVAHAMEKAGGDLNKVTTRLDGHYANAYNWSDTVYMNGLKSYRFHTISEALSSGVMQKGDLIHFEPSDGYSGTDAYGNIIDCHIGFFWGNAPGDNKFWHSFHAGNGIDGNSSLYSGNQISQLVPKSYPYYIYVFPIRHTGLVKLQKTASENTIVSENENYTLAGAQYGVYSDQECTNRSAVLTTDSEGNSNQVELAVGTYYVKELLSPPGYRLDKTIYTCVVATGQTATVQAKEVPYLADISLLLRKVDADTGKGNPALSGALFRVKFYDEITDTDPAVSGSKALKEWVMQTDEAGTLIPDEAHKVSGDALWKSSDQKVVFPYGTLTFEEIEAPDGYRINPEIIIASVTQDSVKKEPLYQIPVQMEEAVRLRLVKVHQGTEIPIKGAVFEHTKPDGSTERAETNDEGVLKISRLACGSHQIQEISAPEGYAVNENIITFIVQQDRNVQITSEAAETDTNGDIILSTDADGNLNAFVADKPVPFQLHIHKINNYHLKLEGAEFTLYKDASCTDPVIRGTTDSSGNLLLKDLIPETIYYLKETMAPKGYRPLIEEDGTPKIWKIKVESIPAEDRFLCYVDDIPYSESTGEFAISGTPDQPVIDMNVINHISTKLPNTGSYKMLLIVGAGTILMMAAIIGSESRRGKKK